VEWRFERPPADAEALFFATVEGAHVVLDREAERTAPGPASEAQVSAQAVYFRRGPSSCGLSIPARARPDLLDRASEVDRALQERHPS
jgi:hypothetical protein